MEVHDDNTLTASRGYSEFLRLIEVVNESIDMGILIVDSDRFEISNTFKLDPEITEMVKQNIDSNISNSAYQIIPMRAGNHGCSLQFIDSFSVCVNNRNTLENYFNDMLELSSNPTVIIDPYLSTVGYWVGSVMEGGKWDYKSHPLYAPYYNTFCSYINGQFRHITSEFFGNFNYGYTGSFLFDLDVLHAGSYTVALIGGMLQSGNFNLDAEYEDWEAIDEGYYLSLS